MTDHTWEGLHSSTNALECGGLKALISGVGPTPEQALVSSQVHFMLLLRCRGVITDGKVVTGHCEPWTDWPDPMLS